MQFIPFYLEMILIKLQFLININSISIISWLLLSISITISITKTGPYQYQYFINFSNFSLSISIPISILQFFPINISLSMHCATLLYSEHLWYIFWSYVYFSMWLLWHTIIRPSDKWLGISRKVFLKKSMLSCFISLS